MALDFPEEVGLKVVDEALDRGLLINGPRKNTLRFMPGLNVTLEEIDRMIAIARDVFRVVA
jgi:acetylornithine/N-succinyldiaminopimelate aminotransferase